MATATSSLKSGNTSFSTEETPAPKPVQAPVVVRRARSPLRTGACRPTRPPRRRARATASPDRSAVEPHPWNANWRMRRQSVRSSARAFPVGDPALRAGLPLARGRYRSPCCWVSPAALASATGPAGAPRFAGPPRPERARPPRAARRPRRRGAASAARDRSERRRGA